MSRIMKRKIEVHPHDPNWRHQFDIEAERLRAILGQLVLEVHHIGSTAIPGIKAKPIIDILIIVKNIQLVDAYNCAMIQNGYLPRGEFGIPGRRFFIKGDEANRSHHLHIYAANHPEIARHLNFRDYLIAHPEAAEEYSELKESLVKQFPHSGPDYTQGKDSFIQSIDEKAKQWATKDVTD
jgi:GrpB-like predicted nucleotidyltransferase (UPF0157 family)